MCSTSWNDFFPRLKNDHIDEQKPTIVTDSAFVHSLSENFFKLISFFLKTHSEIANKTLKYYCIFVVLLPEMNFIFLTPFQSGILDPLQNTLKYCADLPWTNLKQQVAKTREIVRFETKFKKVSRNRKFWKSGCGTMY